VLLGHTRLETTARYTKVAAHVIAATPSPLDALGVKPKPGKQKRKLRQWSADLDRPRDAQRLQGKPVGSPTGDTVHSKDVGHFESGRGIRRLFRSYSEPPIPSASPFKTHSRTFRCGLAQPPFSPACGPAAVLYPPFSSAKLKRTFSFTTKK
jgi:hypothetical protein